MPLPKTLIESLGLGDIPTLRQLANLDEELLPIINNRYGDEYSDR